MELPGAIVPPDWIVVAANRAVAAQGGAALTVTAEAASEPFTDKVPAATVVRPVSVPVPV